MKQIAHIANRELAKILLNGNCGNCQVTIDIQKKSKGLSKNLKGRWIDVHIYLDGSQIKELYRIIVRNNINKRGFLETHELVKNYQGIDGLDAWVERKRK